MCVWGGGGSGVPVSLYFILKNIHILVVVVVVVDSSRQFYTAKGHCVLYCI